MARKPTKGGSRPRRRAPPLTPYQKRIQRYLDTHPGATKQQARGKRPGEAAERRRREVERGVLTSNQKAQINRFAEKQAKRGGEDRAETAANMRQWAQEKGWSRFERLREIQRDLARERKAGNRVRAPRRRSGRGGGGGGGGGRGGRVKVDIDTGGRGALMNEIMEDFDLPDDALFWLYYGEAS